MILLCLVAIAIHACMSMQRIKLHQDLVWHPFKISSIDLIRLHACTSLSEFCAMRSSYNVDKSDLSSIGQQTIVMACQVVLCGYQECVGVHYVHHHCHDRKRCYLLGGMFIIAAQSKNPWQLQDWRLSDTNWKALFPNHHNCWHQTVLTSCLGSWTKHALPMQLQSSYGWCLVKRHIFKIVPCARTSPNIKAPRCCHCCPSYQCWLSPHDVTSFGAQQSASPIIGSQKAERRCSWDICNVKVLSYAYSAKEN